GDDRVADPEGEIVLVDAGVGARGDRHGDGHPRGVLDVQHDVERPLDRGEQVLEGGLVVGGEVGAELVDGEQGEVPERLDQRVSGVEQVDGGRPGDDGQVGGERGVVGRGDRDGVKPAGTVGCPGDEVVCGLGVDAPAGRRVDADLADADQLVADRGVG